MAYIQYPPRDIYGNPRPRNMYPLHIGSTKLKQMVRNIHRRREREPELRQEFDTMERYLWRQVNQALNRRARGMPTTQQWKTLLEQAPPNPYVSPSRADLRRKSLVWHGLRKSLQTRRPLVDRGPQEIRFGRRRWQSPVPRGPPRRPMFSSFRLDYYENEVVPDDPREWMGNALYKRLVQRGRMHRRRAN
jgi:hypothetical protein